MNITGTGTGTVDYQINNEQPVDSHQCVVQGVEDDDDGSLVLDVGFLDADHGPVAVSIAVAGFSSQVSTYAGGDELKILAMIGDAPGGGWATDADSSVYLYVGVQSTTDSATYRGTFHAADLVWTGSGDRDALQIKFGSYDVTMQAT